MSRWKPDSRRRMQDAALELFESRGYADTTAAAVAERAGVTERTFFRHFEDKREVLFDEHRGRTALVDAIMTSTNEAALEMAADGIRAVTRIMQADEPRVRQRAAVVARTPELQERELAKLAEWTTAAGDALTAAGIEPAAARVAAGVTTAIFGITYDLWRSTSGGNLELLFDEGLRTLRSVVTSSAPA